MSVTVWGPGAVGLVLGARLAQAGERVSFVGRNAEAVDSIAREGVHLEDLDSGRAFRAEASAVAADSLDAARLGDGPILVCVRIAQTPQVVAQLARVRVRGPVGIVQNGLSGPAELAEVAPNPVAVVYRQTCTRRAPNAAVTAGAGRIIVGATRSAGRGVASRLAELFRRAGYDVGVSERIECDQWLKLCINLMSAPNALIRREDHDSPAFVAVKTALLEEARAALRAARIEASSCDGRDRSLDAEIAFQRGALESGTSRRALPLFNQVWSALRYGGPIEADTYHRTILQLCDAHGLSAPANARVLAALERAASEGLGPESFAAGELAGDRSR